MNINKSLFWNNGNGHDRPCVVIQNSISNDGNTLNLNFSMGKEKLRK